MGINGVGVNALAKYCLAQGATVSGSDRKLGDFCKPLLESGCDIKEGENVQALKGADALVYTSAVSSDNKELVFARENGIPTFERHEFLAGIAKTFNKVVGIAGSHGKTTVTAMLTHILKSADINFVSMIGGDAIKYSNFVNNKTCGERIFVTEACEFRRHMLTLGADVTILLNKDWDHPDSYPTRESVEEAFDAFLKGGKIRISQSGANKVQVYAEGDIASFEYEKANDCAKVYMENAIVGHFGKNLQGEYNKQNALFAVAAASALGVKPATAIKAVNTFYGVKRRFEKVGEVNGIPVVFDFAHHPTEIKNLLDRASEFGKVFAVFQPHTYSRTRAYIGDFAQVFAEAECLDTLILVPTYAAREAYDSLFDSDSIMTKILSKNAKRRVYLAKDALSSVEFAKIMSKDCGIILFIGAGDIYELRHEFE
ncbi:MAG: hypothetical protein IJ226_04760 [Clostridia bacterium]|nr:hypothetical protein [Clostridia bacterium]